MAQQVQQKRVLAPFRYNTRLRIQPIPIQSGSAQTANGAFQAVLPSAGLLESILVRVSGTVGIATTPGNGFVYRWPWDVLANLNVQVNVGAATIYSTSGYGNYIVQRTRNRLNSGAFSAGVNSPSGPAGAMVPVQDAGVQGWCSPRNGCIQMCSGFQGLGSQECYTPVNVASNPWQLIYEIPIAANMGEQFQIGLLNLQAPEIVVTLGGQWGAVPAAANILGGVGTVTPALTLDAAYRYYELPDPNRVQYPPTSVHRIIESRQSIGSTGDFTYTVPREGVLYRLMHILGNLGGSTGAIDDTALTSANLRVMFNKSDTIINVPLWFQKWAQNRLYGELPYGVLVHDLWAAMGNGGMAGWGDSRDMISAEDISTFESIFNVNALGTTPTCDTIREFAQVLAM